MLRRIGRYGTAIDRKLLMTFTKWGRKTGGFMKKAIALTRSEFGNFSDDR
jgi:hypothetical protein